ncbi:MAG: hypothetical protein ABEI11_03440 [Haloarculaceae archaeon]
MRPSPAVALLVALAAIVAGVPVTATGPSPSSPTGADASGTPADPAQSRAVAGQPRDPTAASAVVAAPNSTNYLTLAPEEVQASQVEAVTLDASGSAAVDDARLEAAYLAASVREDYRSAPNETAARAAIRRGVARLTDRIDRLAARERRARERYNAGDWGTRTYLRELAAINAAATRLQGTVEELHSFNRAVETPVDPARLARLKLRLLTLQGPVRAAAARAMTGGESDGLRVFVATSETGTVLSTVIEDGVATRYLREAYLGRDLTLENTDRTNVSSIDAARERFLSLYPWATSFDQYNIGLLTSAPYYLNAGVYALGVNHPQGTNRRFDLEAYLDTDTGKVFREYQYVGVDAVRMGPAGAGESADLRVVVEGTYVGGPMRVNVTDPATGNPVEATVRVDGTQVGTTGTDGTAAALVPGRTFTVTVTRDGRTVTVEASLSTGLEGT